MPTNFAEARYLIVAARSYLDIFTEADPRAMKTMYRRLMKTIHPDRVEATQQILATDLVVKLGAFYRDAESALQTGSFGRRPADAVLSSARGAHVVVGEHADFCDITQGFRAKSDIKGRGSLDTFVKVARVPRDNDLLATEAAALTQLHNQAGKEFTPFYPELVDSFGMTNGTLRVRANVLKFMQGFMNLEEVRARRPDGLDPLHMAWIWRRVLWALGGAHSAGVVHAAVLPRHIIVHPVVHGVLLVDWCYSSVKTGGTYSPLKALVGAKRSWYPAEVLAGTPVDPRVDLAMAARSMSYLMGGDPVSMTMPRSVPAAMNRYFIEIVRSTTTRTAFDTLAQFDTLLEQLGSPYYPRVYRELRL